MVRDAVYINIYIFCCSATVALSQPYATSTSAIPNSVHMNDFFIDEQILQNNLRSSFSGIISYPILSENTPFCRN